MAWIFIDSIINWGWWFSSRYSFFKYFGKNCWNFHFIHYIPRSNLQGFLIYLAFKLKHIYSSISHKWCRGYPDLFIWVILKTFYKKREFPNSVNPNNLLETLSDDVYVVTIFGRNEIYFLNIRTYFEIGSTPLSVFNGGMQVMKPLLDKLYISYEKYH